MSSPRGSSRWRHRRRQAAREEPRIALVIGNSAYRESPLRNPVNDVRAMAQTLRELGFTVLAHENATKRTMETADRRVRRRLAEGGVGAFYYAGHGLQVRGRNYLVPVDAEIDSEAATRIAAVDVELLLEQMAEAKNRVNIVILDACRNNPFERRLRGASRGLAAVDAARGTLVAYATAPGLGGGGRRRRERPVHGGAAAGAAGARPQGRGGVQAGADQRRARARRAPRRRGSPPRSPATSSST